MNLGGKTLQLSAAGAIDGTVNNYSVELLE